MERVSKGAVNAPIMNDFESWEADNYYYQKEDWPGLVRHRERVAYRNPHDYYDQWRLGEAYVLNGEYQKAIDHLAKLHHRYPDAPDVTHSLLDALFALGKDEDDFDWIEKPVVLRLNEKILDRCYQYLRPKRKPREIYEIRWGCFSGNYLAFTEEELLKALRADPRFKVEGRSIFDSEISVQRKR